jgi:hypothetical protein
MLAHGHPKPEIISEKIRILILPQFTNKRQFHLYCLIFCGKYKLLETQLKPQLQSQFPQAVHITHPE